jgi:hypothetical protein
MLLQIPLKSAFCYRPRWVCRSTWDLGWISIIITAGIGILERTMQEVLACFHASLQPPVILETTLKKTMRKDNDDILHYAYMEALKSKVSVVLSGYISKIFFIWTVQKDTLGLRLPTFLLPHPSLWVRLRLQPENETAEYSNGMHRCFVGFVGDDNASVFDAP